jgi:hypothetical protein
MFQPKVKYAYIAYILIVLIVIINTIYYYISYHRILQEEASLKYQFLDNYAKTTEAVITNELKKIFTKRTSEFVFIKNYASCDSDKNDLVITYSSLQLINKGKCIIIDLSKIREVLNQLSGTEYIYNITLNTNPLISNSVIDDSDSYYKEVHLSEEYKILLQLNFNQNSAFRIGRVEYLCSVIQYNALYSTSITLIIIYIIFLYLKEKKNTLNITANKNQTRIYINKHNNFILECYKFSQEQNNPQHDSESEYFPIPIIHDANIQVTSILPSEIFDNIENYFNSYLVHNNLKKIKLSFFCKDDEEISIPFAKELLNQLFISIIFNLLNFSKKSEDTKSIKVTFANSVFTLESNGFQLNKQIAIMASQRIFYDSCNPFILNFNQIIGILEKYKINMDILSDKSSKIIIDFKGAGAENALGSKIINLESYKKS